MAGAEFIFAAALAAVQPPAGWQDGAVSALLGSGSRTEAAQAPVSTQPLAANEVLLETAAGAAESAPADRATFTILVSETGGRQAEAEAARDRVVRAVTAAARAAGARDADIDTSMIPGGRRLTAFDVEVPTIVRPGGEAPQPDESLVATATVKVTVRGAANIRRFQDSVPATGAEITGNPQLELDDDTALRRAARSKALATARADAEAYAASLNMRVARIVRITERSGGDFMSLMFGMLGGGRQSQIERMFGGGDRSGEVPVLVFIGVDFALVPR
jgi:uncharacterized protein